MFSPARLMRVLYRLLALVVVFLGPVVLAASMLEWHSQRCGAQPLPGWLVGLRIARDMIPVLALMSIVFGLAGYFVRSLYDLPSIGEGWRFLMQYRFGLTGFAPYLLIREGRIHLQSAGRKQRLIKIGGPGNLVIYHDSAAVLEKAGRLTRIEGSAFVPLEAFERIYGTVDLRPKRWSHLISAATKEGIPIRCECHISFTIKPSEQAASRRMPFPVLGKDILKAVTSTWVRKADSGEDEILDWEKRLVWELQLHLRSILARYSVHQLVRARDEIEHQLERALSHSASEIGAQITSLSVGDIQLPDEVQDWIEKWQREQARELASGRHHRERVKQSTQAKIVSSIIQALYERMQDAAPLPPELILMQFSDAIEDAHADPMVRARISRGVAHKLESLRRLASWDSAVSNALRRLGSVGPSDVPEIPSSLWPEIATRYRQLHRTELPLTLRGEELRLERGASWVKRWGQAVQSVEAEIVRAGAIGDQALLSSLADVLTEAVGMQRGNRWYTAGGMKAILVTRHSLRLGIPRQFPMVFVPLESITSRTPDVLIGLSHLMGRQEFFSLVIPLVPEGDSTDAASRLRRYFDESEYIDEFIVLSNDDILKILTAPHPGEHLVRLIVEQVAPESVSPFVVQSAVSGRMFFGRDWEIRVITQGVRAKDFVIVGNRRIGKTSLLQQIELVLQSKPMYFIKMLDLQGVRERSGLYRYLAEEFSLSFDNHCPEEFRVFVSAMQRLGEDRQIVLLVDEVDRLLTTDRAEGYPLSAIWRELSQSGRCHFVFAGHRTLSRIARDGRSPFFNFAERIALGPLERTRGENLLVVPLEEMGIALIDRKAILDRVWDVSRGHPNVIQYLGQGLLHKLGRTGRRVRLVHLDAVIEDTQFIQNYFDTMWGGPVPSNETGVAPLERAVLLLAPFDGFSMGDMRQKLLEKGFRVSDSAVYDALEMLQTFRLLTQKAGEFVCSVPFFLELFRRTQDIDYHLDQLRTMVNNET